MQIIALGMRSVGERALVAMRAPLKRGQRGQVARMSDHDNTPQ